jgi:hypothetical protein
MLPAYRSRSILSTVWVPSKGVHPRRCSGPVFNMRLLAANCLVTDNTLHVRLADYAMISPMSGR